MFNVTNKFPYLELRLFAATIVSIMIIIFDSRLMFLPIKNYIEDSIFFCYRLCHQPIYVFDYISNTLKGYTALILENNALNKELFLKNSKLLLMDYYKQENYKLHDLLHSPICKIHSKLITPIFFINTDMHIKQIMIHQGINNGVYIGQPVIADTGVVGQIISVNNISSRILLISDRSHALSVKLQYNNTPMILIGCGDNVDLYAEYFGDADIRVGDILVTSGLDGKFPEGCPVATVSYIKNNLEKDSTIIRAIPIVKLQYLRYVVLLYN